jgi:hypothetical protein
MVGQKQDVLFSYWGKSCPGQIIQGIAYWVEQVAQGKRDINTSGGKGI